MTLEDENGFGSAGYEAEKKGVTKKKHSLSKSKVEVKLLDRLEKGWESRHNSNFGTFEQQLSVLQSKKQR